MAVPEVSESFAGSVNQITLGAGKEEGGSRTSTVTVGRARNVVYGGSVEDAAKVFEELSSGSNIQLQIKRRGRQQTLDYSIE